MKKTLIALAIMVAVPVVAGADYTKYMDVVPGAGITNTAHDLRANQGNGFANADGGKTYGATNDDLQRICIYCHAPHHTVKPGAGTGQYLPLWNRGISNQTFSTYTHGSENPTDPSHQLTAVINQPGTVSKLCLSCHDGSIAVNAYGSGDGTYVGSSPSAGTTKLNSGSAFRIGGDSTSDLTNHHPIGFNYLAVANVDNEIASPDTIMVGSVTIGDLLWNNRMECTTCHDVHNSKNTGEKFLWTSDQGSGFCLKCHKK